MMIPSRRDFLKTVGLIGMGGILPSVAQAKSTENGLNPTTLNPDSNSRIYSFAIGNFEATLISDGEALFPTHPLFAPEATPEQVDAVLKDYFLPVDKSAFHFNVLLVKTGKEVILVDTGLGGGLGANGGKLLAGLALAGVTPDQITGVILTHAHFDHFGGLLTSEGKPVFAKAQHYVTVEEWNFWNGKNPDLSKMIGADEAGKKGFVDGAVKHLQALKSQFVKVTPTTKLPDGVTIELAPGHTPGHAMVRFTSGSQQLLDIADLAHNHVLMFAKPDWTMGYDTFPEVARTTRRAVFAKAAAQGTRALGYHLPFPGLGHIRSVAEGYQWVPEGWNWIA